MKKYVMMIISFFFMSESFTNIMIFNMIIFSMIYWSQRMLPQAPHIDGLQWLALLPLRSSMRPRMAPTWRFVHTGKRCTQLGEHCA